MATYSILYWQEIPYMIRATDENKSFKVQLSSRFQDLIDAAAMKRGLAGTDQYLEQWRYAEPCERAGSAEAVAHAVKEELEAQFGKLRAPLLGKR